MEWLSILWFILIAVLWTGYLVLEGFDLGVGMSLRILAKNDKERSAMVRTIGPHWDGNEVWLLTAGGATFAAFPEWYATMFSGMYFALFVVLLALILRIGALEWRVKIATQKWRSTWDSIHMVSAWLVPVLLGVAFANLVQGMAIEITDRKASAAVPVAQLGENLSKVLETNVHNLTGGFFSLLTPFTLLGGLVVAAICYAHGVQFLALKLEGDIRLRAEKMAPKAAVVATALTAVWALWAQFVFANNFWSWIPLLIAALALIGMTALTFLGKFGKAFTLSVVAIAGAVSFIFSIMALSQDTPVVMRSYIDPQYSLTLAQASATSSTLTVMTIVAAIFVPIVLLYTAWSYWKFRDRVSTEDVAAPAGLDPKKIRLGANFLAG